MSLGVTGRTPSADEAHQSGPGGNSTSYLTAYDTVGAGGRRWALATFSVNSANPQHASSGPGMFVSGAIEYDFHDAYARGDGAMSDSKCPVEGCFYGSVTVGERGQVVIPAEARAELEIKARDKILVMRHPMSRGLVLAKFEDLRSFLDEFIGRLDQMQNSVEESK